VHAALGFAPGEVSDLLRVQWLTLLRAGLTALDTYQAATNTFGSAHGRARFFILRTMLEACPGLVRVEQVQGQDGPDMLLHMAPDLPGEAGRAALGRLLLRLQVWRSTGDVPAAAAELGRLSAVSAAPWPALVGIARARRQPRAQLVQHGVEVPAHGAPRLLSFPATAAGAIAAFQHYHPPGSYEAALHTL
jgi:dipeptidyl-peptidase-3